METIIIGLIALVVGAGGAFVVLRFVNKRAVQEAEAEAELLKKKKIQISMDGKGRAKDNIWIERFWRTIKQEYIYLNPADDGHQLRLGISKFMEYYNFHRPHHSLPELLPYKRYNAAA